MDKMRQKILLVSAAAFILSLVTACSFLNPPFPALDTGLIYTSAAKTFAVEHPSQTPQPAVTITPTLFPSATATPIIPPAVISTATLTNTPSYSDSCYYDSVVTDENIPDGTEIYTGESFEKTWEFYNSGTCSWNEDFSLVFIKGRRMGGTTVYLGDYVYPGEYIEVTVDLTAPSSEGEYVGYWQLLDGNGILFGDKPYIDIEVIIKPTATQTRTMTKTMTRTSIPSPTATRTRTPTLTSTYTVSPTSTLTSSPTPTFTPSPTITDTPTPLPSSTDTLAPTATETPAITPSPT
jgi:hypothetical protein